ncbi:hypothetical protein [Xanthocytophaga flava]|uniref:hypothetical protein n=1 Tax=Xanthocytophaga flava TaxID=3048013 RepID=UPI0028D179C2|nr:hypothetical protein [Xanthocytophaga flavus]MDJ1467315.1 hypothetical protein [Xanthocytophaga flavus]
MKKNTLVYRIFALALIVTILAGCKKEEEVKPSSEQNFTSAQATIDLLAELETISNMASGFGDSDPSSGKINKTTASARLNRMLEQECGTSTYTRNEAGQRIYTFDYGTGVVCDSVSFKGKITFVVTTIENGYEVAVPDFNGYTENGRTYNGSYVVTITRIDSSRKQVTKYNNASVTYEDGSQIKWSSTHTLSYKLDVKENLPNGGTSYSPSVTSTTGEISGINKKGTAFTATIEGPILTTKSCNYRKVSGNYLIETEGYSNAVLDYGDGTCDDKATLTIDGVSKTITIK